MPEGDTIHRLASALAPRLEGRELVGLRLRHRGRIDPLEGAKIGVVGARGKHLLVDLGERHALHVHLGMKGRWRWDAMERGASPRGGSASLCLDVPGERHVCRHAAIAEVYRRVELAGHPQLARLGPDLLAPELDVPALVPRARRRARPVGELLLDQRVACGLGNVYRSEVLFAARLHPATPVAALADASLVEVYRIARDLLRRNLGPGRRCTVREVGRSRPLQPGEPRYFVYRRAGRPCLRCAAPVRSGRQGDAARTVYWCERCQPAGSR